MRNILSYMALDQFSITVRGWLWLGAARLRVVAQCDQDERLDLGRRHPADERCRT
jgi:hypothetical protein